MPLDFATTSDTGATESSSVKPILATDPVDPTVSNRPSENLRVRTEVLKSALENQQLLTAVPVLMIQEIAGAGDSVNVHWDGPYVPGTVPPTVGYAGSGMVSFSAGGGQFKFYLPNSGPLHATATIFQSGSPLLVFTTTATAAQGANALRVYLVPTQGQVGAAAGWELPNSSVGGQAGTLKILISNDVAAKTTAAQIATALAGLTHPLGFTVSVSSPSGTATEVYFAAATTPVTFSGALDSAVWTLSAGELGAFFTGADFNSTLAQEVIANAAAQVVHLAALPAKIVAGMKLIVGPSNGAWEEVTLLAVDDLNNTITAVFSNHHVNGETVVSAPNRLRAGDSLLLKLGDGLARLSKSSTLTQADLAIPRSGGIQQDTPVVVVASCPKGTDRLLFNGQTITAGTDLFGDTSAFVRIGGDIGGTPTSPAIVHASASTYGTSKLSEQPTDQSIAVAYDANGVAKATGLSSPVASTTLAVGTGTNDAGVTIGKAGAPVAVPGNATLSGTNNLAGPTTLGGVTTVAGQATFQTKPVFSTDVDIAENLNVAKVTNVVGAVNLTGLTTQRIGKQVGDLEIGTTDPAGSGDVYIVTKNAQRWKVNDDGNMSPVAAGYTIQSIPDPTNGTDVSNRQFTEQQAAAAQTAAQTYAQALMPAGTVLAFAGQNAPPGFLLCDGSSFLRSSYTSLFAVIGTTYGAVDATHFNVPDLRGEFIRGLDNGRNVDSGRALGTAQADDFKSHTHPVNIDGYVTRGSGSSGGVAWSQGAYGTTTNATGGTETRPRNVAMNYIIKS